ncbi:MAG: AMP-binding protein, partial [Myxococcota bacterium]
MNIASQLRGRALARPDAAAVVYPIRGPGGRRLRDGQLTFRALDRNSDHVAAALEGAGIGRGTRTVMMVPPGREFVTIAFALQKLGAVLVLIDPGIGPRRLARCLAEAEPVAFIGVPRAHLARALLGWARRSLRIRIRVGGAVGMPGTPLSQLLRDTPEPANARPIAATAPEEMAGIFFTSGSTGAPKGVVYSHGTFDAQLGFLRSQLGLAPEELDLATFPPFALFDPALGITAVIPAMDAS